MPDTLPEVVFHIYPTDCDMLGHLNHATMLGFLERARWALFDHRMSAQEVVRQPIFPVIRHVDIGYRAQTLPGEDLAIRSGILKLGTTSYTVRQEARNLATGALVAEANIAIVAINREGKPVPVPGEWKTTMPTWPSQG